MRCQAPTSSPVVTLVDRGFEATTSRETVLYIVFQIIGGCLGAVCPASCSSCPPLNGRPRHAPPALWLSEVVATVGLLLVIHGCVRSGREDVVAFAVGLWIGGAYWFTSSTSFANPAVTIARTMSNTFAGIAPSSAPMFIVMQLIGAVIACACRFLYQRWHRRPDHVSDRPRAPMPNLDSLSLDQQLALRSAARNLPARIRRLLLHRNHQAVPADQLRSVRRPLNRQELLAAARRALRPPTAQCARQGRRPQRRRHTGRAVPVYVHNAGRSQMALGWFNHLAGRAVAWSGGSEPGSEINPAAVRGDGRSRHRHHRRIPQTMDRRSRPSRRRRDHDGLRRRLSATPANATKTGNSTTQPDRVGRSGRSATRSAPASNTSLGASPQS